MTEFIKFALFMTTMFFSVISEAQRTVGNPAQARRAKESLQQLAKEKQDEADEARVSLRYVEREPFVPRLYDYGLGLGGAWGERNYYALSANLGFHVGTCVFSESQTCQQYFDLLFNVNGRDSHTHYLGMGSLRWQFIHFPSPWSPSVRLMAGADNQIIPGGVKQYFAYGAGVGLTTFLHPKADIRVELQAFQSDVVYTQVMFLFQFKMEKWVEYFAEKLQGLGIGATGEVVKSAVEITGKAVKGTGAAVQGVVTEAGDLTGIKKKEEKAEPNSQPKKNE